jgi:TPR repeat protein
LLGDFTFGLIFNWTALQESLSMSRIFLSHSSVNNAEAIAIRDWMIAQGWTDVFLDLDPERGLVAGDRWQAALKAAVDRCELVVIVVSPDWAASAWCKAEFLLTKHGSNPKAILPVIVAPTPFSALPSEMTAEYQQVDLTSGIRSVTFTVTLPPDNKTSTVAFSKEGLRRLKIGIERAGVDATYFEWPPVNDPNRPPYRGLRPLEADDAGIFFGRDAPVIEAIDRLRGLREAVPPRLLVILGASGAGKSSFLRAGILPRLKRDDRHFLPLPVIRPDRAVISGETGLLAALEGACRAGGLSKTRAELRAAIDGGAGGLRPILQVLADKATPPASDHGAKDEGATPKAPTIVMSIDQGEELFLPEGKKEAEAFLTALRDLLTEDSPALTVLFTIRSDNYERLQLAKGLEGIRQQALSLPPMPKGSYAVVIEGPSRRLDGTPRPLKIEESLVAELLADIEDGVSKDALPLLAFILERLYLEYGAGGNLKLSQYRQIGGIQGSIEAAVARAFNAADVDPKIPKDKTARLTLLRRGLIPWIAGIDPDTGAPRRRVARMSEIPAEAVPLIQLLVEQRLLSGDVTRDGASTIEPVHEALLRQWGLLQQWLKEDTGLLIVMDGVKRAARDWENNQKGEAWLTHTAGRLGAADQLSNRPDLGALLETTDRQYLAACREAEAAARGRTRRMQVVVGGLTLTVVLIIGVVATKYVYAEYIYRTAIECDLMAAERDNNVGVSGVEYDRVVTAKAIPACESAVRVNLDNPRLMHNLGRSYDVTGKYKEAAYWYGKAADLGWASSQNNLGVAFLYGRGVVPDLAKGVALLRSAAERDAGEAGAEEAAQQAHVNYAEHDFTNFFDDVDDENSRVYANILERALVTRGLLKAEDVQRKWNPTLSTALEAFKKTAHLPEKGITLRVLDKLGVVDELSASFHKARQ